MDEKHIEERRILAKKINEYDNLFEKNKFKRSMYTIIFYTIVNMILFYWMNGKVSLFNDIWWFLGSLVVSLILAGICFFVNATIFSYLINKGRAETEQLQSMKKQLTELEKADGIEKNSFEDRVLNGHM